MKMKAKATLVIDERSREILKLLNFHEIPEEAKYVAFLEDGDACFLEGIEFKSFAFPHLAFLQYHTDVEIEIVED